MKGFTDFLEEQGEFVVLQRGAQGRAYWHIVDRARAQEYIEMYGGSQLMVARLGEVIFKSPDFSE